MRTLPWFFSLFAMTALIADEPANNPIAYMNYDSDAYSEENGYRIEQKDWDDDEDDRERAEIPYSQGSMDFFVTGDFIYWKSRLEGMDFAQTGFNPTLGDPVPEASTKRGKLHDVDFDYVPGYKAGGGMNFLHGGWDVTAEYTWLSEQHGKRTVKSNDVIEVVPSWFSITSGNVGVVAVESAKSKWRQNFNVVDAEIGKNFDVNRWFSTRVFAGLKFSWIKQKFSLDSFAPGNFKIGHDSSSTYKIEARQNYWGAGIRFGADSVWQMSKFLGIYGDLAVDAMWSSFREYRTDKVPIGSVDYVTYAERNHIKQVTPIVELGIGLSFQAGFCDDMFNFIMRAGWEQQVWFDFNQFNDIIASHKGNLTMQGLTIKIGLGF